MIVRISNRFCLCQIASSTIRGDDILVQAHSRELSKFGLPGNFGLKNWTACYATGLLLARRVLKKLGMISQFALIACIADRSQKQASKLKSQVRKRA
jgi:large subunit ribosomal protein L5e